MVNMVNTAVNNNIYAGRKSGSKYNQSKAFQQKEVLETPDVAAVNKYANVQEIYEALKCNVSCRGYEQGQDEVGEAVLGGELGGVVLQEHGAVVIPAGRRVAEDDVDGGLQLVFLHACAILVLDDRDARHAAEQIDHLLLVRQEIAEAVVDQHVPAVRGCEQPGRLQRVRMAADDEIRACVRHLLRPAQLTLIR